MNHILEPDFGGRIGRTVSESEPWWPSPKRPPAGAPNVVMVVLDDVGYAQVGCYGSDISTPAIDGLAAEGLRFTNFHVTPLCSPTRACLLTGRNHHSVGMGMITGFPSGFPHGRESISKKAATVSEVLRDRGFGTYALGKWHLTPMGDMTPAGPFDHWPLSHGFDRFYGFLGGETDQYRPNLVSDNRIIVPPYEDNYHVSEDLVDQGIEMIAGHRSATPDRPFFLYLAFGACHGPLQAPGSYLRRYRGAYDDGWDAVRARWFARQIDMGLVPEGTGLAPRNPGVAAWESLPGSERRMLARYQEVFAGFLEHTDAQIGRLMAALDWLGCADDTLTLVLSDNGAAGEGGPSGSWNELIGMNGLPVTVDDSMGRIDQLGSPDTYPQYPVGWAQVGNTPCKWYKHHTFGGGVRAPLVVHWPGRVADPGGFRRNFRHAIDVTPTILEACRIDAPDEVGGVAQLPVHGESLLAEVTGPDGPPAPRTQYFEMKGHRGIYHDGWKAVTFHQPGRDFDDDAWELYHLDEDFSELTDLAGERLELVARMKERWWDEAVKFGVLPLDDRFLERAQDRTGTFTEGVSRFVYYRGMPRIHESAAADVRAQWFRLTARLEAHAADDEGVIASFGGRFGGFVLYVRGGGLIFEHNSFGEITRLECPDRLPVGEVVVAVDWTRHQDAADVALRVGADVAATAHIDRIVPYYSGGNGIEIGGNWVSAVSDSYQRPYAYTGRLDRVTIDVDTSDTAHHSEVARANLRAE